MRVFQENGEAIETMTTKDVYMFPIMASSMLFGLYLIVKVSHLRLVITLF